MFWEYRGLLEAARDNARKAFPALPVSPERYSVLGALGQIGKATLMRKVQSRTKLISDIVGDRFSQLNLVVDHTVDCRSYYVHGSVAKIDYCKHFDQIVFFAETVAFIFAASALVELGWDIDAWTKQGSTLSHPFGRYRASYAQQLCELRKLL